MGEEEEESGESGDSSLNVFIIKLLKNMSTTSAARFNAAQRSESRSRMVNLMLALLASSVIVLSVLPMIHEFSKPMELSIFLAGLAGSIFVVVLSLYQWSSRDDVNAEKFHQAGLKISAIRREMALAFTSSSIDAEDFSERYTELLRECGANHEDIDFIRVRLDKSDEYKDRKLLYFYHNLRVSFHKVPALAFLSFIILLSMVLVAIMAFMKI